MTYLKLKPCNLILKKASVILTTKLQASRFFFQPNFINLGNSICSE